MLHLNSSILYSQNTSTDSLKCFTYSQARKILTDLRQLPLKDSIILKQDSIISKSEIIIKAQGEKVENQRIELYQNKERVYKLKRNRKFLFIFGAVIGLMTQLIF